MASFSAPLAADYYADSVVPAELHPHDEEEEDDDEVVGHHRCSCRASTRAAAAAASAAASAAGGGGGAAAGAASSDAAATEEDDLAATASAFAAARFPFHAHAARPRPPPGWPPRAGGARGVTETPPRGTGATEPDCKRPCLIIARTMGRVSDESLARNEVAELFLAKRNITLSVERTVVRGEMAKLLMFTSAPSCSEIKSLQHDASCKRDAVNCCNITN